jgi:hypothetical protein
MTFVDALGHIRLSASIRSQRQRLDVARMHSRSWPSSNRPSAAPSPEERNIAPYLLRNVRE